MIPYDIAGHNVSPHVMRTKGPVVHLANFVEIFDSNDLPKNENFYHLIEILNSNDIPMDENFKEILNFNDLSTDEIYGRK